MKISKKRILEIIKEECGDMGMTDYGPHHDKYFDYVDDEGGMAKRDLFKIAKYAMMLHDSLQDDDQLEGWVQSKITKAADYIGTVAHYLEYEMGMHMMDPEMDDEEVEVVPADVFPMDEDY
jgi:hypothetical protein